jgi:hypothetical protein
MTQEEVDKKCAEVWKSINSWDMDYMDFVRLTYVKLPGQSPNGNDCKPGDEVYPGMSRAQANDWCDKWKSFQYGFYMAYKTLGLID